MFRILLLVTVGAWQNAVFARTPPDPCRTKSRHMTLVKNCYSGDMSKANDSTLFFAATPAGANNVAYCYNALISAEHRPGEALIKLRVLKESKDGQFHALDYSISPNEFKGKKEAPLYTLKGLKGTCFSPTRDK